MPTKACIVKAMVFPIAMYVRERWTIKNAEHLLTSHRALTVLDKFCYKLRKDIDRETVSDFIFWAPKSLQMVILAMKLKDTCSLE